MKREKGLSLYEVFINGGNVMDKNLDIFYFSSTHWDREWYQDFQTFRYRLVRMINKLIDTFDQNEKFETFHFDGQTIILEDYSEIPSPKIKRLKELIKERKILVGPWYVMPDEFLLSGESLIKNLIVGHNVAKEWGADAWKYGYVCDIFGHIAQMPQIFNGFNISYSLLGRGTTENYPTFFRWVAPDGSECLNFKLDPMGGYGSFKQVLYGNFENPSVKNPKFVEALKRYIDSEIKRSKIPIVVVMDGLDHSEVDSNVVDYIKKIAELYPNAVVHHKNLCEQGLVLEKYRRSLPVIEGELNKTAINQNDYLHLITNTLSSYYTIKKQNDRCQNLLEKITEPICVMSDFDNVSLNRNFVNIAYKYLLKNHAHDSICGCSIDQVHKDMEYRFDQVKEICNALEIDYLYRVDNRKNVSPDNEYNNIIIFRNLYTYPIDKTITLDIEFPPNYKCTYMEPFGYEVINSFKIFDYDGNEIPYQTVSIARGVTRRVYDQKTKTVDVHKVSVRVQLPPFGKAEYLIVPSEKPVRYLKKLTSGLDYAENEFIRLNINVNGTIKITDKKTGMCFDNLCSFLDDGEIGDGWYHVNPVADTVISSLGGTTKIQKIESGPSRCVFEIIKEIVLPEDIDARKNKKMHSSKKIIISMKIGLSEESRYADVKLNFINTAKDHRLKMIIPTGITVKNYFSGQAFYCCDRNVGIDYSTQNWCETEQYEKATNGIIGKRDSSGKGIAFISAEGIHECFSLDDESGTIGVTLLRSFKNTVGTNGETKCQIQDIPLECDFLLAPIDNDINYADLLRYQNLIAAEPIYNILTVSKETRLNEPKSYLSVEGDNVFVSIVKKAKDADDAIIVRVFNASEKATEGKIKVWFDLKNVEQVNLNEEFIRTIPFDDNKIDFAIKPWKIQTFKLQK